METATATTCANYAKTARPSVVTFARKCGGILRYRAVMERIFEDFFKEQNGYERFTTFCSDFATAECFGDNAIKDTFNRASASWLSNYKYYTEFIMVLNHLCWFWHANKEHELSQLYSELYYAALGKFDEHYGPAEGDPEEVAEKKREACAYYYKWTD